MATNSILRLVRKNFRKLCSSFTSKYPNAVIGPFLIRTNRTTQEEVNGKSIWAAAGRIRKQISGEYTPIWNSCLDNGAPPSGRDWDWVRKRTLVLVFRKFASVNAKFKSVQERAEVDEEFKAITSLYPMWGISLPYSWLVFMTYGCGVKCADESNEPHAWTLTSPTGLNRKNASRAKQRLHSDAERREQQQEANARHRTGAGMSGDGLAFASTLQQHVDITRRKEFHSQLKEGIRSLDELIGCDPANADKYKEQKVLLLQQHVRAVMMLLPHDTPMSTPASTPVSSSSLLPMTPSSESAEDESSVRRGLGENLAAVEEDQPAWDPPAEESGVAATAEDVYALAVETYEASKGEPFTSILGSGDPYGPDNRSLKAACELTAQGGLAETELVRDVR